VIIQYSSSNTGNTQVEKGQIEETKATTYHVYTTIMSCLTTFKDRKYNIID
jgi:hypothetical protein